MLRSKSFQSIPIVWWLQFGLTNNIGCPGKLTSTAAIRSIFVQRLLAFVVWTVKVAQANGDRRSLVPNGFGHGSCTHSSVSSRAFTWFSDILDSTSRSISCTPKNGTRRCRFHGFSATSFHSPGGRFHLQPPRMQQWLGVATRLCQALEHQITRGLVRH